MRAYFIYMNRQRNGVTGTHGSFREPGKLKKSGAGVADDLTAIKGIGRKIAIILDKAGISSFAQIAEWEEADIRSLIPDFADKAIDEQWVSQAGKLAVS